MKDEGIQSKNWPDTQWKPKESLIFPAAGPKPNIIFPKIKDLLISKRLALSKPIQLPDLEFRITSTLDQEQYERLSTMVRTNMFPGCNRASTSSYSENYCDHFQGEDRRMLNSSSRDFRRKKGAFSKRLESDLDYQRLQAAWKEYYETQPPVVNWEQKAKGNAKQPPIKKKKPRRRRRPPPPLQPPPPETADPVIPSPDLGDMDIFKSNRTPEWAKDEDSIPEELDREPLDNDDFWALYDDPF